MIHRVTTYKELEKWSTAFANGSFGLFFIIGHQGQAKSSLIKRLIEEQQEKARQKAAKDVLKATSAKRKKNVPLPAKPKPPHANHIAEPLWVEGGAVSAFKLYIELYMHLHETVVMDDVDSVYSDRNLIRLLKALCQTEKEKSIGWHTDSRTLENLDVPSKFRTRSRVCIIANRWKTLSEHVGSLVDRGMMIHFEPSPQEVFNYCKAKKVCTDKDIIKFVGDHLWMVDILSLRTFVVAEEAKKAKLDWKAAVAESLGIRDLLLLTDLEKDSKLKTNEARVMEFCRQTRQSRPMFFKAAARLTELRERKSGKVPAGKTRRGRAKTKANSEVDDFGVMA